MTEKTSNISYGKASVPATTGSNHQLNFKSSTGLGKAQEYYMAEIGTIATNNRVQLDAEQMACGNNMIAAMFNLASREGLQLNSFDRNEIIQILQKATMLRLNVAAEPHECYLITRNQKVGNNWVKKFEFGIEGDGNDKLLRKYGVDVAKTHKFWIVREHDEFTYPSFNGLEITPPTWKPKDYYSKVTKVVYPIEKTDGTIDWNIAEREEVRINLLAHINQNVMKNKDYTDAAKVKLSDRIANMTLDELFADQECLKIMSPAWAAPHSRESMILRKMRNNATRRYPKEFSSAFQELTYTETIDETPRDARIDAEQALEAEVEQHAGTEQIAHTVQFDEATGEVISEPAEEPKKETRATVKKATAKAAPAAETVQEITADDCPF